MPHSLKVSLLAATRRLLNRVGESVCARTAAFTNPQALPVFFNNLDTKMTAPKTPQVGKMMAPKMSPPVAPSMIGKSPCLPSVHPFPDSEFCTALFDANGMGVPRLRARTRANIALTD